MLKIVLLNNEIYNLETLHTETSFEVISNKTFPRFLTKISKTLFMIERIRER